VSKSTHLLHGDPDLLLALLRQANCIALLTRSERVVRIRLLVVRQLRLLDKGEVGGEVIGCDRFYKRDVRTSARMRRRG
jgi:hypothetical protein